MANQPLAFGELLAGGILLTMAITGHSAQDVIAGSITPIIPLGGDGGGTSATTNTTDVHSANAPTPSAAQLAQQLTGTGTTIFDGHPVVNWMIPALTYARKHGWTGNVISGVRSTAEQATLYQRYLNGGNLAAKPGQSNHEIENGGAVDVTDPFGLAKALDSFSGRKPIQGLAIGDIPHFSLNGH